MIDDEIKIDCEANDENATPNNSDEIYKRSEQTIKKDVDKGMAMIYMMCVTLLWPIVLIKNLFFNGVK